MVCFVHPQNVEEAPSPRLLGAHLHPDNIPASFYEKKTKVSFTSSAGDVQLHTAATSICVKLKLSFPQRTAAFPNVTPGFRCLVDDSGNSVRKRTDRRMDPALRKNVANVQSSCNCCSRLSVLVSFLSSLQVSKISFVWFVLHRFWWSSETRKTQWSPSIISPTATQRSHPQSPGTPFTPSS